MSILKKLLFFVPVLAAGVVLYLAVGNRQKPEMTPPAERVQHVRVITVEPLAVVPRVSGFGAVRPAREWNGTSQVSGEIIYVHPNLKTGQLLPANTEIITISPVDYELAIAQAEANIRSSEARISELEVNRKNTQQVLNIEKQALEIRERELARQRELLAKGTVSKASFDRETRDTFNQRKKVLDMENALRLIPTQIAVQQEQKKVYQAQLKSAQLNLARTHVRLPFDARIGKVNVEKAQIAQAGQTLVIADGISVAEVEAQIPIEQFRAFIGASFSNSAPQGIDPVSIRKILDRLKFKVKVVLESGGEDVVWEARFARLSDTIDPKTRTLGVIAAVDGAYAKIIPGKRPPLTKGMFVKVELTAAPHGKQIVVPRFAVSGGNVLVSGKDNRLEVRKVTTGFAFDDIVAIRKGLAAGDSVVVSDLSPAVPGMLLAVTKDEALQKRLKKQASQPGAPE